MGLGKALKRYIIYNPGRIYGLCVCGRDRVSVVALCRRGIIYRFGARVFQPHWFYWESLFGVRKEILGIKVYQDWMAKNEIVGLKCGLSGLRCTLHRSRTGVDMFIFTWLSPKWSIGTDSKNPEIFASLENDLLGTNKS